MKPKKGDVFTIPLNDGDFVVGQVIQYDTSDVVPGIVTTT